jgi:uncharacterized protein (TIGR00645 family)
MTETHRRTSIERALENALFASRWLLAPFYLGLAISLVLLLISFARKAWSLLQHVLTAGVDETTIAILSLIDLSLVANLLLIVIFAGWENFVSRFDLDDHRDKPDWVSHIGLSDIKLKLMTSIVAISAIHVLEDFLHVDTVGDRELAWGIGIHMAFVISALLLALMDRLSGHQ